MGNNLKESAGHQLVCRVNPYSIFGSPTFLKIVGGIYSVLIPSGTSGGANAATHSPESLEENSPWIPTDLPCVRHLPSSAWAARSLFLDAERTVGKRLITAFADRGVRSTPAIRSFRFGPAQKQLKKVAEQQGIQVIVTTPLTVSYPLL